LLAGSPLSGSPFPCVIAEGLPAGFFYPPYLGAGMSARGGQVMNEIWTEARVKDFSNWLIINKGRSAATVSQYVRAANSFFTWAEVGGNEVNPDGVREWLRFLYFEHGCLQNSTRAGRLSGLRTVCAWLMGKGILTANPTNGVESPTFRQHAVRKLDTATLFKLLNAYQGKSAISIRNRAILMLLYSTGMRRAELCSMNLERITLGSTTGRVHIIGKGAKERTVGFRGAPILEALNQWIVRHVLKRAAKISGVKPDRVHLHLLRSTFATDLYDSGVPVKEIALLLGHADESTTWRRYIALSERHLKKAMIPERRWRELGVR